MRLIGKIRSLHGVKGDVILSHTLPQNFDFENMEAILIELLPGSFIPFFIEEFEEISQSEIILHLEEYKDRNTAKEIINKNVYAPANIEIAETKQATWETLKNVLLFDQFDKEIGMVTEIIVNGPQILLQVQSNEKQYLIPFDDSLVVNLNQTLQHLQLEIAEGLLDI